MNPYSTATQEQHQRELEQATKEIEERLRQVLGLLMQGAEWSKFCASDWRLAKEVAAEINERLGDPCKPRWREQETSE